MSYNSKAAPIQIFRYLAYHGLVNARIQWNKAKMPKSARNHRDRMDSVVFLPHIIPTYTGPYAGFFTRGGGGRSPKYLNYN
jgi:hypothetical protein